MKRVKRGYRIDPEYDVSKLSEAECRQLLVKVAFYVYDGMNEPSDSDRIDSSIVYNIVNALQFAGVDVESPPPQSGY